MPTYTTLDKVKNVLRASDRETVRFSDSLTEVELSDSNDSPNVDMGFKFNEVQTSSDFKGDFELKFKFTSPTLFNVYQITPKIKQEILLDTGADISASYTTPDGMITIPSTCWFGTIETGDRVYMRFDSHLSDAQGDDYIEQTEVEIDGMLSESTVDMYVDGETRHFDPADPDRPVPDIIAIATAYLAAYYIYTGTFVNIYKEQVTPERTYAGRWKKRAEKLVKSYIESEGYHAPRAAAFPTFIDQFGVQDTGPGLSPMTENFNDATRDAQTGDIFE